MWTTELILECEWRIRKGMSPERYGRLLTNLQRRSLREAMYVIQECILGEGWNEIFRGLRWECERELKKLLATHPERRNVYRMRER
jgi:hypothetical protein